MGLAWRRALFGVFVMWFKSGHFARSVAGAVSSVEGVAMRNLSLKYGPRLAALGGAGLALVGQAQAAVPAAFTDAIDDATTDGAAMAGSLLGVAAAVVIVMIALKFVKRIKGAV
jgi:hypothetical protein